VITNLRKKDNPDHEFLSSGNVARLLGCSLRAAATLLDKHEDLVRKMGIHPTKKHRRITRRNFFVLLDRENITAAQIGLGVERLGWLGTPVAEYASPDDLQTGAVSVIVDVMRGELSAVACINHQLSVPEVINLATAISARYVRFAAMLPDDAGIKAKKSNHTWLFLKGSRTDLENVMLWLRGVEITNPRMEAVTNG